MSNHWKVDCSARERQILASHCKIGTIINLKRLGNNHKEQLLWLIIKLCKYFNNLLYEELPVFNVCKNNVHLGECKDYCPVPYMATRIVVKLLN